MTTTNQNRIVQRRAGSAIQFCKGTSDGPVVATLLDGSNSFIFDPLADTFALMGLADEVATEEYFNSIGLTVKNARMIDAMPGRDISPDSVPA